MTRGYRDVLDAVHQVRNWRSGNLRSQVALPQFLSCLCVQSEEVSLPIAREEHIARGGKDAGVTHVPHLVTPYRLARRRVDRFHRAITPVGVPLDEWIPFDGREGPARGAA